MNFVIREARESDLSQLYNLSAQFPLLSLPHDQKKIAALIQISEKSFSGALSREESVYLFVAEDLDGGTLAGSSQIKAQKGSEDDPAYAFKVQKREKFSQDLGIGFIHQILSLRISTDGPSEIGGLVASPAYRKRPEKIGRLVSFSRFMYIAMNKDSFSKELLSEMAPPLTDEGRSEFWEALGRRFTGMPYQEADRISHENKEFIRSLFPQEDIYLCLLDAKARLVLGQVNEQTRPALKMLEKLGFSYKNEVDPFDGGPHLGVATAEVTLIKNSHTLKAQLGQGDFSGLALVASKGAQGFRMIQSPFVNKLGGSVGLPQKAFEVLDIKEGNEIFFSEVQA